MLSELGVPAEDPRVDPPAHAVPLPSRLATGDLAWASVRAVIAASGCRTLPDPDRIALGYRSDAVLTVDGTRPDVWSPLSGFWRSSDGWIRTHANYPHHARRLRDALRLPDSAGPDDMRAVIGERSSDEVVDAISRARGLAVVVGTENPALDRALQARPLLEVDGPALLDVRLSPAASDALPLAGIRVLDLTRVIAGPVCTRTLALLGADVLRIDPPTLPEPEWQHLDTGHGKRSTVLDARSSGFRDLLDSADVVVLGYRPASLARLGLSAEALRERHPRLLIAELSAWGAEHPDRAGFDSLVQAESGIAMIESPDGATPSALPAQALDHSAGYLLAAGITALLGRRAAENRGWSIRTSLRRIAAELLGMPRQSDPAPTSEIDTSPHTRSFAVAGHRITTVAPVIPGLEFSAPRPWGSDQPTW
ncbi:CoA transferase [Microbacterium sp.]|uniref:CoA transferase n=1 Tax=Microbacterium sp. TaxID=51671 RepID=UPI0028A0D731|nr:CoA transferase [Microbacterium sp.]